MFESISLSILSFSSILVLIMFISSILVFIFTIRNNIVLDCRKRLFFEFNYPRNPIAVKKYHSQSYNEMLWNFKCWTFKSFYGDIDEIIKG